MSSLKTAHVLPTVLHQHVSLEYHMLRRFMWSHHGQKRDREMAEMMLFQLSLTSVISSTIIKYLSLISVVAHYSTAVCSCLSVQQISGLSPHHIPPSAQKA